MSIRLCFLLAVGLASSPPPSPPSTGRLTPTAGRTCSSSRPCRAATWPRRSRRPSPWATERTPTSPTSFPGCWAAARSFPSFSCCGPCSRRRKARGPCPRGCPSTPRGWTLWRRGWEVSAWLCAAKSCACCDSSGNRAYDGPVLAQAGWLGERLRAQGGRAEAELAELALEVLEYAGSSANPVFLDSVLRLQASSREAAIARLAAAVAARLAKTASESPAEW